MENITLIATAKFGLEKLVKNEVIKIGFDKPRVSEGRIEFEATLADIPRLNINLRYSDRLVVKMAEFPATTFDELFEQAKALPWEKWITEDGKFTVNAKTVKSTLQSDRTCQSIVKKAVVERLKSAYDSDWFEETGANFTIQVTVRQDVALITLDTSGAGLHKRGYRLEAGEAPLTETLAAALVKLSFWEKERLLIDPMCGAGTILIEAALLGRNIAPGLNREFAAEGWPVIPAEAWTAARQSAREAIDHSSHLTLWGYDIDEHAIHAATANAERAGVANDITFGVKAVQDVWIDRQYGIMISNPPYGMRMYDFKEINRIYISLNKMFRKKKGWSVYILTADKKFPHYFKRSWPDRKRKLYNGNIEVTYYQYYGERPPRIKADTSQ
ncbi:MAG: RNA methyltransferase [Chloroflexi bacterium]|nr:MAG: RNA methyltransferase [Chloroflexota bacterium]